MPLPPVVEEPLRRVGDKVRAAKRFLDMINPDPALAALKRKKKELEKGAGKNSQK